MPVNLSAFVGKKIISVLKNRESNADSILMRASVIDSLDNCTVVSNWESTFLTSGEGLFLNTRPTRVQVAYKDGPDYFFDSNKPVKLPPVLDVFSSASERIVNKNISEKVSIKKYPELYQIFAFDTLRCAYLFFTQDIPTSLKNNDMWVDSAKVNYVSLVDTFTVKSIDGNKVTLHFSNKLTVDRQAFEEKIKRLPDSGLTASYFNTANYVQGYLVFDRETLFIYTIAGEITIFTGSEMNGVAGKRHSFSTKFSLSNSVE
ncbi:MAG TPA: hypothetical protein VGI43_13035 [Mucilaginibacter sp.]